MKHTVLLLTLGFSLAASESAKPADGRPTPRSLLTSVEDILTASPQIGWASCDLDGDGKPSALEALASLKGNPAWWRQYAAASFKLCDTNHDNAIDVNELSSIAAREKSVTIKIVEKPRTISVTPNPSGAMGGTGFSLGGGSNGATASCFFGNQQAYIMGYRVVGGNYEPIIGVISYGTALEVGNVVITVVQNP